ncbi:Uncharacterised protein [Vibrio mimicus]|nr:Uncharacterised protein [Vibrio mimicus]
MVKFLSVYFFVTSIFVIKFIAFSLFNFPRLSLTLAPAHRLRNAQSSEDTRHLLKKEVI